MNKLEEQIDNQCALFYMQAPSETSSNFESGAQFVIDLQLPIKFVVWLNTFEAKTREEKEFLKGIRDLDINAHAESLYQFWIDNIYWK